MVTLDDLAEQIDSFLLTKILGDYQGPYSFTISVHPENFKQPAYLLMVPKVCAKQFLVEIYLEKFKDYVPLMVERTLPDS